MGLSSAVLALLGEETSGRWWQYLGLRCRQDWWGNDSYHYCEYTECFNEKHSLLFSSLSPRKMIRFAKKMSVN